MSEVADLADVLIQMGSVALAFGRVDRITYHPDGITPESDTDHTVMLGWMACALAARLYPELHVGLVAQLALVHDAPEVYAGDTPTLRISAQEKAAKSLREAAAVERLDEEFGGRLSWFPVMIALYEEQRIPEARFVRALDKVLPFLTDLLNEGMGLVEQDMDAIELRENCLHQRADMATYAREFPKLLALHAEMTERVCALPAMQKNLPILRPIEVPSD
jgi:putative hydrolase of HD superfamily